MDDPTLSIGDRQPRSQLENPRDWGPFRLIERVAQGSFGEVYRAWDTRLEREVAVKLLFSHGTAIEKDEQSVLREARAAARVRHPNVVPVYGVDRFDGRVGLWTDFVRGKTLSAILAEQGPFGARETTLIAMEICRALSAVHSAGLLHRDIKAGNVMREEGGRILLMDFGLSHDAGREGAFGGTPAYMAPEVLSGVPASERTDIYAVGVLIFRLVTGKYLVESNTASQLAEAHFTGKRRQLADERPDLPEAFVRVVRKAIEPEAHKRFGSAGEMLDALSQSLGGGFVEPRQAVGIPWRKQGFLVAALLIALLAPAALYLGRTRQANPDPASPRPAVLNTYMQAQNLLRRYDKTSNIDKAIALYSEALDRDPKNALANAGLARAYLLQYRTRRDSGLLVKAKTAADKALDADPQLAPVHVAAALVNNVQGATEIAMQEAEQALRLDPRSADASAALADVYESQGRSGEVEATLQKAIDMAPDDWRWPNQLGFHYYQAGKIAEAVSQYDNVVRLTPDNSIAWSNLGSMYSKLDRLDDAHRAFAKSIAIEPRFSALSSLGPLLQLEGKYAEAADVCRRATEMNPSNYAAWGNLGSAYDWMPGGKDRARVAYMKAVELGEHSRVENPRDARLLANLSSYYVSLGERDKGLILLRQALALAPENVDVMYKAGENYEVLGMREQAMEYIRKALSHGFSARVVKQSPDLAGLRADRRFADEMSQIR